MGLQNSFFFKSFFSLFKTFVGKLIPLFCFGYFLLPTIVWIFLFHGMIFLSFFFSLSLQKSGVRLVFCCSTLLTVVKFFGFS